MFSVSIVITSLFLICASLNAQAASSSNDSTYTCYVCTFIYGTGYCDDNEFHTTGIPTKSGCACCTMKYSTAYDASLKKAALSGERGCYSSDEPDSFYKCKLQKDIFTCQSDLCNVTSPLTYSTATILMSLAILLSLHLLVSSTSTVSFTLTSLTA